MRKFSCALLLCLAACSGKNISEESIVIDGQNLTLTTDYLADPAANNLGMTSTFRAEAYGTAPLYKLNFTGSQKLFTSVDKASFIEHVEHYAEEKLSPLCSGRGAVLAGQPELIGDSTPIDESGTFGFVLVSNRPGQVILRMRCN